MSSKEPTANISKVRRDASESPESVVIDIPPIPTGFHCVVSLLFYGSTNRKCTLRDENHSVIALHDTRRNVNKTLLVGLEAADGHCTLELIGVTSPEQWSPLSDTRMTPMGPVSGKVYSYTEGGVLDEKILITIIVQAGVLPDIFKKDRVINM